MKLYLGIDGGGTKTKVCIIDQSEKVIFENTSGPSSIDTVDNFTTMNNIRLAIKPFVNDNPDTVFTGVFSGLGGIVFQEDCLMVENQIRQLPQITQYTFLEARNDMHNALYSSNHFDNGITLICGTGMVAFGKNGKLTHKAGGWSYQEGELGSGFNLGREAIRYCIRAYDNRYKIDNFAKEVAKAINLKEASDIIAVAKNYHQDRTLTASLAPIVTKHANLNNRYAKKIVDRATDELALAIKAVYKTLKFKETTLVIVGSLGNADGYFKDKLHQKINKISDKINIIAPVIDPALAAAKAAKYLSEETI